PTRAADSALVAAYQPYGPYDDIAELTHDLVIGSVRAVFGSDVVRHSDGSEHDLGRQRGRVALRAGVSEAVDRKVTVDTPVDELRKLAGEFDVEIEKSWSA